jgi:hypothetical protein
MLFGRAVFPISAGVRKTDGWFSGFSKYAGEWDCGLLVSQ